EELFLTHAPHMRLPDTHMVMSVPAFLFTQANNLDAQFGNGATRAWPAYRVRDRQERRTDVVDRIIRLVERRGDWRRVLPDQAALERLIVASGGHLRDLLNMLREALFLATDGVGADAAEKVTSSVRRAYLPIYKDEIELLGRIARRRDLQDIEVSEREQVLRFLDAGLLLCYLNDDFWYDVHPLVRDLVLNAQ
ncbi:MAG TPA: hypothetical protein VLS89_01790, partial [Candidatus Nanopelagicales bacterium]|nr:hypothetical protein [Candidatus Nanopelagicales bacterium]